MLKRMLPLAILRLLPLASRHLFRHQFRSAKLPKDRPRLVHGMDPLLPVQNFLLLNPVMQAEFP